VLKIINNTKIKDRAHKLIKDNGFILSYSGVVKLAMDNNLIKDDIKMGFNETEVSRVLEMTEQQIREKIIKQKHKTYIDDYEDYDDEDSDSD